VLQLVGPARVVEEVGSDQGQVDVAGLADRLAVVDRLEDGQLAGPLLHQPGDAEQVLGPLAAGHRAPHLLVRGAGGGDGPVDVGGAGGHDLGEDLLGGRVHGLERRAVDRVHELAADEQPVAGRDVDDAARLGRRRVLEGVAHREPQSTVMSSGSV
jgi:ParB family chromosome partitioning protein